MSNVSYGAGPLYEPKEVAAYPRLVSALRKTLAAFSEMSPRPEDYKNVNDAALLLQELGEMGHETLPT